MKVQHVIGLASALAVASISVPTLLSAQGGTAEISQINIVAQDPQATISLLGSGKIRVSGEFALEIPHRAAAITGPTFETDDEQIRALGGTVVTDYGQGMTVQLWGYVIDAESGSFSTVEGLNQRLVLRNAVISHSD